MLTFFISGSLQHKYRLEKVHFSSKFVTQSLFFFFSFLRRENKLRLPHGWICYLAPEIVQKMSPGNNEDRLPFSTAADVYAFG